MKIKLSGFIHQNKYSGEFGFYKVDMSKYGELMVGPAEFEVDYELPKGWNPAAAEISMLEKKLDALSDEYQKQANVIKSRIKDLQCIGYTPEAA